METPVLLWTYAPAHCTLETCSDGFQPFEVRVYISGVLFVEQFFSDHTAAADFAIAQMHIYETARPVHPNEQSASS